MSKRSERKKRAKTRTADPFGKNWEGKCQVCDRSPTVNATGLCGPCTWGEADTAGGNW
jgi:hypothetical protein